MRILLSAFACEVGKGSEPGLGWTWASRLSRAGHHVWVITRSLGREANEQARMREGLADNLHFIYYDQDWFPKAFSQTHFGYYAYCQTWQFGAYLIAKGLHERLHFDAVHHVTFATVRFGSLMGKLGIPFTFGPVAGGQRIPWRLRHSFPFTAKIRECVRDVSNISTLLSPLTRSTFRSAKRVLVTNGDTVRLVPGRDRHKCEVQLGIGTELFHVARPVRTNRNEDGFRALYVGKLEALKGIHLALRAFARFHTKCPNSKFTIVGHGPQEKWLRGLAAMLRLNDCVRWVPWMPRDKVLEVYASHDVFLFPSLRDSGGMVVLEALAKGLPVICLDLAGPGLMIDNTCGRVVSTKAARENDLVVGISNRLAELADNPPLRERLSRGALQRVQNFDWDNVVRSVYGPEVRPA